MEIAKTIIIGIGLVSAFLFTGILAVIFIEELLDLKKKWRK